VDKLQPEQVHTNLKVLADVIDTLPEEIQLTLSSPFGQLNNSMISRQETLKQVQLALGQLRLDVKYLMFDLEATRRERDTLKKRLGE
jgi:hypothetical protein